MAKKTKAVQMQQMLSFSQCALEICALLQAMGCLFFGSFLRCQILMPMDKRMDLPLWALWQQYELECCIPRSLNLIRLKEVKENVLLRPNPNQDWLAAIEQSFSVIQNAKCTNIQAHQALKEEIEALWKETHALADEKNNPENQLLTLTVPTATVPATIATLKDMQDAADTERQSRDEVGPRDELPRYATAFDATHWWPAYRPCASQAPNLKWGADTEQGAEVKFPRNFQHSFLATGPYFHWVCGGTMQFECFAPRQLPLDLAGMMEIHNQMISRGLAGVCTTAASYSRYTRIPGASILCDC